MVRCLGASGSGRRGALLALLLIASFAVPVADAQSVVFDTVQVKMTPTAFDAELRDQQIVDDRAVSLRTYIDEEHGDADGIVTTEEYEAYRVAEVERFNGQIQSYDAGPFNATSQFGSVVRVEGKIPLSVAIRDVRLSDNVVGSASDNGTIQRHIDARLGFRAQDADRINVSLRSDFSVPFRAFDMKWVIAHFTGDGDWAIDIETLQPEAKMRFWQEDRFVVAYEDTYEFANGRSHTSFDLVNTAAEAASNGKSDKKGSPALAAPAVLLAVIALAALARRRL